MSWETFMAGRPIGVLATIGADGTPHAVPVEIVVDEGRVFCWCRATSVKARNAARTGRATMVAYKGNSYVMVRGGARLIDATDPRYEPVTQLFLSKYERDETYGNDVLIEVTPERVTDRTE